MTNPDAEQLAKRFLENNDSLAFEELWESTVNMAQPHKYYDPHQARTTDDFLQITRIGLFQALNSYKKGKGSTLLTWIRMRMTQVLIKEVRKIDRQNLGYKISLDQPRAGLETGDQIGTIEQQIYSILSESEFYRNATQEWSEDLYLQIVAQVTERVSYNIPLSKCYGLKLAFPNLSRKSIALLVGVTRPAISHYFAIIRKYISMAADQYALSN